MKKVSWIVVIAGAVVGLAAVVLTHLGNPANMGFCIACFLRDITGAVGMHGAAKVQYVRPEIIGLVLGGIFMIAAEKMHKHFSVTDVDHITWKQALKIGLFQCLSLWPGFSRSGSTIAGSLLLGISRKAAADFTFIMAVPLMFLACIYDLLKTIKYLEMGDFGILAVGFVTAFFVAYASILWFLKFLNTSTLTGFAIYRFLVALVALIYFW